MINFSEEPIYLSNRCKIYVFGCPLERNLRADLHTFSQIIFSSPKFSNWSSIPLISLETNLQKIKRSRKSWSFASVCWVAFLKLFCFYNSKGRLGIGQDWNLTWKKKRFYGTILCRLNPRWMVWNLKQSQPQVLPRRNIH